MSLDITHNPTDKYSRYFLIVESIKKLFPNDKISVLEVGGANSICYDFIKKDNLKWKYSVIDILQNNKELEYQYYLGKGYSLPFKGKQFDVVFSTDTFEHIPNKNKKQFILEQLRVSKNCVIISAPFNSKINTDAEIFVNSIYKLNTNHDYPWLKEHFELEKPNLDETIKILHAHKFRHIVIGNNSINNWLQYLSLHFISLTSKIKSNEIQKFFSFANTNIFKIADFNEPTYRKTIIATKNKTMILSQIVIEKKSKNNYELNKKFIYALAQLVKELNLALQPKLKLLSPNQDEIVDLKLTLKKIQSSKFYKIWQLYCNTRDKLFKKNNIYAE